MRAQFSNFPRLLLRTAICLVPGLFLAFLAVLIAVRLNILQQYYLILEAVLYVIILGLVLYLARVNDLFKKLPPQYLLTFAFVLVASAGAQLAGAPKLTYPLGSWDMYTSPEPFPLEYYEFVYVHKSGRKDELFKDLHPIRARTFAPKFVDLYLNEVAEREMGDLQTDFRPLFHQALASVAEFHPANTEADPFKQVILYRYDLLPGISEPEKHLLIEVNLDR